MNSRHFKESLIQALRDRGLYFRQVNEVQYQTRCPSCGDKEDNLNTGHLYLRINPSDNSAVVFNCFRCPYHGILTGDDLELLGITDSNLKQSLYSFNKNSAKYDSKNIANTKEVFHNFQIPEIRNMRKLQYITDRLKTDIPVEEFQRIRVITSLRDFMLLNGIKKITCSPYVARLLDEHYIGFLTSTGNQILFRDTTGTQKYRWVKYKIFPNYEDVLKDYYAIPVDLDIMSVEPITINMCEGVIDILSIVYNLGYNESNCLNVSVGGKYYVSMINRLIHMGLVGDNISINIFSDNDGTYDTSIPYHKKTLGKFKPLFKSITIHYNRRYKDCGVPKAQISLTSQKL